VTHELKARVGATRGQRAELGEVFARALAALVLLDERLDRVVQVQLGEKRDLLSLPWVVSPSRKWRAESAEREHGEGDDGFL